MSHLITDDRCSYVCTDKWTVGPRTREDGWRCGDTAGHVNGHMLYTSDGEEVMYQGGAWKLPEESEAIQPGSDQQRQSSGLPGHCEDCADRGHVAAHPELGCSDVGCTSGHEDSETAQRDDQRQKLSTWTEEVVAEAFGAIEIDGTNYLLDPDREQVAAQGQVAVPLIRYADTGEVEARLTAWVELEIYQEDDDE